MSEYARADRINALVNWYYAVALTGICFINDDSAQHLALETGHLVLGALRAGCQDGSAVGEVAQTMRLVRGDEHAGGPSIELELFDKERDRFNAGGDTFPLQVWAHQGVQVDAEVFVHADVFEIVAVEVYDRTLALRVAKREQFALASVQTHLIAVAPGAHCIDDVLRKRVDVLATDVAQDVVGVLE